MTAFIPLLSFAAERKSPAVAVTRISVLSTGKILLDGKDSTVAGVRRALASARVKNGTVWYYREKGQDEPAPAAIEVFKLIVENKLPISVSTKADFSDYVDEKGQSHPR